MSNGTSSWNRPHESVKSEAGCAKKAPSAMRGIIAGLVVVAIAAVCVFIFSSSPSPQEMEAEKKKTPGLINEQNPAAAPKPKAEEKKEKAPEPAEEVKYAYDKSKWDIVDGHFVPKGSRLVNNYLTNKVERIFKYSTDSVILGYLEPAEDGVMPPPHPIMPSSEKTFLKSLEEPIEILETDSDKVREMKEKVIVARAQIKERMDAGETFEAILTDQYKLMSENTKIRRDAQKELDRIYKSGDMEGARKYKLVIDTALSQMNIDSLEEPNRKQLRKQQRKLQDEQQ